MTNAAKSEILPTSMIPSSMTLVRVATRYFRVFLNVAFVDLNIISEATEEFRLQAQPLPLKQRLRVCPPPSTKRSPHCSPRHMELDKVKMAIHPRVREVNCNVEFQQPGQEL
ncbi:hypothetical protein ACLOJK_013537 [Asimina triloba]